MCFQPCRLKNIDLQTRSSYGLLSDGAALEGVAAGRSRQSTTCRPLSSLDYLQAVSTSRISDLTESYLLFHLLVNVVFRRRRRLHRLSALSGRRCAARGIAASSKVGLLQANGGSSQAARERNSRTCPTVIAGSRRW